MRKNTVAAHNMAKTKRNQWPRQGQDEFKVEAQVGGRRAEKNGFPCKNWACFIVQQAEDSVPTPCDEDS